MPWIDWLSLFVRWFHVVAGVAWIGASFYFIWLDNSLKEPPKWKKDKGIKGDLWAVHGGGFYEVAKYSYGPEKLPEKLHWFKWEAYSTWLSGFALLILVYYFGASAYLIDPSVMQLEPSMAIALGVSFIFVGFGIYELACRSPLGNYPLLFGLCLMLFICFACWLSSQWFSGRGAYIHVGALIGTMMTANVFLVIMPSQRKMVDAVANAKNIDANWGLKAKLRSVHNNYFTLPLLFIMISNHYPMTYQHEYNWLVLALIIGLSAWIRHFFNLKHNGQQKPIILVTGFIGMAVLALWISWPAKPVVVNNEESKNNAQETLSVATADATSALSKSDKKMFELVKLHCSSCHSATPSDEIFTIAPLGVVLDTWEDVLRYESQIIHRTTVTRDMPFMNKTQMSEQERQRMVLWHQERAK